MLAATAAMLLRTWFVSIFVPSETAAAAATAAAAVAATVALTGEQIIEVGETLGLRMASGESTACGCGLASLDGGFDASAILGGEVTDIDGAWEFSMTSWDEVVGLELVPGLTISVCIIGGDAVIEAGLLLVCDITEPSSIMAAAVFWLLTILAKVDSITCLPDC